MGKRIREKKGTEGKKLEGRWREKGGEGKEELEIKGEIK